MYFEQKPTKAPWWKEYWGINVSLGQSSVGTIVFLPIGGRTFAVTFGTSFHCLDEKSYEYDFGIKVTLNTVDSDKIKSTDLLMPATAKRQRIQIPNASGLSYFDFSSDESILKRLTGAVKEQYRDLLHNATGSNCLRFASDRMPSDLVQLCSQLLDIYSLHDYKEIFPDLHNIVSIKDPEITNHLDNILVEHVQSGSTQLSLSVPELIDYSTDFKVKYQGVGGRPKEHEDVSFDNYQKYLASRGFTVNDVCDLRNHSIVIFDDSGNTLHKHSIYKSLLFDCTFEGKTYHLCEGAWYEVNKDFITKLKHELDAVFADSHSILCECNERDEGSYNLEAEKIAVSNGLNVLCLDKKIDCPRETKCSGTM